MFPQMKQIKYIVEWKQTYAILVYKLLIYMYIRTRSPLKFQLWNLNQKHEGETQLRSALHTPPPLRRRKGRLRYNVVSFLGGGGGRSAIMKEILLHNTGPTY